VKKEGTLDAEGKQRKKRVQPREKKEGVEQHPIYERGRKISMIPAAKQNIKGRNKL